MVACFTLSTSIILMLQYFKLLGNAQRYILATIYVMLVVSGFIEGSGTGQYFYFFAIVVVIPVIVDYKNSSNLEFGLTYLSVIISFSICFVVGQNFKPIENISPAIKHQMLYTNAGASILLTLCFSVAYIYYEKKHLKAINTEKNNTIAARTKFLSTMGHELRTPLNGIIGALNIIENEHEEFVTNEYFSILKYCSNHMRQLINDILDFNKIEANKLTIHPVEVNLKQLLVNSTLPFYNYIEGKNLQLVIEIDPELDTIISVDDVRLIQILNNLLSNAMKFTDTGYVKLIARCNPLNPEKLSVHFEVEDSGIGISADDQLKIFESFGQVYNESTRKYTGTGLGLTICVRLLQLMESSLNVHSVPMQGSTFSFDLCLKRSANQYATSDLIDRERDTIEGVRILIVEDNQINMLIAQKMLTTKKAICDCAYNGKEALDMLAIDSSYDIILLDLEMPVMDGHTAITEIKKRYKHIPVIALTASLFDEHTVLALLESGFSDCILKPFQPNHLFTQIARFSNKSVTSSC